MHVWTEGPGPDGGLVVGWGVIERLYRLVTMLEAHTFTVSELGQSIAKMLDREFDDVWISGHISGLNRKGRSVYFDLIEPDDQPGKPALGRVNIALFGLNKDSVNKLLKRDNIGRIEDGMQVRIRGAVDFYSPTGRLSVRMTGIDPSFTLAKMVDGRDKLLQTLSADGLLDLNATRPVPDLPLRVGLVTSKGSAAYHDFVTELGQTPMAWQVVLIDSLVQGQKSPDAVAAAIRSLDAAGVDVIAVVRGGGSKGDLQAFDSEAVARAIVASNTAVFTGIGHEIDSSVADQVAHSFFKTPTACAAAIAQRARFFDSLLVASWLQIRDRSTQLLDRAALRLDHRAGEVAVAARTCADQCDRRLQTAGQRLGVASRRSTRTANDHTTRLGERIAREAPRVVERAAATLDTIEAQVGAYDPARALARGWSITTTTAGDIVRTTQDLPEGTGLRTVVADGIIDSVVTATSPAQQAPSKRDANDG